MEVITTFPHAEGKTRLIARSENPWATGSLVLSAKEAPEVLLPTHLPTGTQIHPQSEEAYGRERAEAAANEPSSF